uniref:Uncharacterized protein n=1 Tax=Amphimedon queenslandica TaxID=400682 RepID=A0A1X7VAW7_AMPQE
MSEIAVDSIISDISLLLQNRTDELRLQLCDKIPTHEKKINEVFNSPPLPFCGLETKYLRHRYFVKTLKLQVLRGHQRCDGLLSDFCDAAYYASHPLYSVDKSALQIISYYDDVEICNPLGSRTKKHKLVRYGPNVILEPVMSDIKELEQNGLVLTTGNSQNRFYGSLFLVPGDNLASQYLGGYESLASAHRKCSTCMTTNEDMQNKVAALFSATRPHIKSTFGLCQDSVFHQSHYFHITDGLVPDIMHNVLEGCLPYVMKEMMKLYIDRKLISLNDMNDLISFPYGSTDFSNKPSVITSKTLKSSDHALKQTGRLLPLIVGHLIPENDLHWNNFCLLLTIIDYLFAPTLPQEAIDNISVMIADHHKAFVTIIDKRALMADFKIDLNNGKYEP